MSFLQSFTSPKTPRPLLGRPEAQELMASRMPWILGGMVLWAVLILGRLVWLQVVEHRRYATRALQQHTEKITIEPIRGELRDRRNESLAISLRTESLFANPPAFYPEYTVKGEERIPGPFYVYSQEILLNP